MGAFENALGKKSHDELVELYRGAIRRGRKLEHAVRWALGEGDAFPLRQESQGAFYWRSELRRRSGMIFNRVLGRSIFEDEVEDAEVVQPDGIYVVEHPGEILHVHPDAPSRIGELVVEDPEAEPEVVAESEDDESQGGSSGGGAGGGLYGGGRW